MLDSPRLAPCVRRVTLHRQNRRKTYVKGSNPAILFALLLFGWPAISFAQACDSADALRFLTGEWIADGERTLTRETWTRVSSRTFEGMGEVVEKTSGSRQSAESLRLVEMSGEVFYVAKVGHNALPIAFKLVECSNESAVFENAAHDFPRRLEYRRTGADSLVVSVSDGTAKGFTLRFVKQGG